MSQMFGTFGYLIVMLAFFYFILIRPNQKKNKQLQEMRSGLSIGNNVVTIGGIAGTVLRLTEEDVTIEVGADKTKLTVKRWAIGKVE